MSTNAHYDPARVGRRAPAFEVACTRGVGHAKRTVCLEDYRDRWLILMFYPLDFSLVCPTELVALSNRYEEFVERGVDILGISTDSIETHDRWIATPSTEEGLGGTRFPLGSDPDGEVARKYGVYVERQSVALRGLTIIDPNSIVQYQVVHNLSVGRRIDEILRVLTALQTGGLCAESWTPGTDTIDPTTRLRPGSQISHYRIEEILGDGGFATVYKATDKLLGRPVAVKILKRADKRWLQIQREARAAAALNHPNVCTVYSIGDSEGFAMMVMEYLPGRTLASRMADGPVPADQVASIGSQIASGIAAAHAAHVVHGDLKPANIMLTNEDTVKILDFGLAGRHQVGRSSSSTQSLRDDTRNTIAGTPSYMSPEQVDGSAPTTASDVFALGLILYEMLVGKRSLTDLNLLQVLSRIRTIDADQLAGKVDEPFRSLLQRMLVRDPAERSISMHDVEGTLTNG